MSVPSSRELEATFAKQRAAFRRNPYPEARLRREHLKRLECAVARAQDELARALDQDFGGRSKYEVLFSEILVSLNAIRHARKHTSEWMRARPRSLSWLLQPARACIMPQPLGVVGIIAPWNYPIFLCMAPLAGALAAGDRVMVKVSEFTPATSEAIANLIRNTFDPDHVSVATGDADAGRAFSSLPFDHLLFTGSTAVGREVMRAAAANLTPVTLELGGKSPAIVAPDGMVDTAAADIAYGKFLNAGQTCIAPDYAFVPREYLDAFVEALTRYIQRYWPDPVNNPDYTSVINDTHYGRLLSYIEEARERGADIIPVGSASNAPSRRLAPTLVVNPADDSQIMRHENFGPVLPIKVYNSMDEVIAYINDHEHPLALYLFSESATTQSRILERTISGGVAVNETLVYIAAEELPFGGVGASGLGRYHGQEGFDTFSHLKPVFRRRFAGLSRTLRPPYRATHGLLRRILIG